MSAKGFINSVLEKAGVRMVSTARIGVDLFTDLRKTGIEIRTAFDVGANVGQTSRRFLREFPDADIHAFEPVLDNFERLMHIRDKRLTPNRLALGAEQGSIRIFLSTNSGKHSAVIRESEEAYEDVGCQTLTGYCLEHGIEHIGLLKIDTEGGDLDVLKGAAPLLSNQQIDFVLVETGFYPKARHVHICSFMEYLAASSYRVAGIYDQAWEWDGRAHIQFANLLFVRRGITVAS